MPNITMSDHSFLAPDFTPVKLARLRHNGWTPDCQRRFIAALAVMGSVGRAVKAVGKGRTSAYALRDAPGAESFVAAWDTALAWGQDHVYDLAMEAAINGITTIRIARGGAVTVGSGPDMKIINAGLRQTQPPPSANRT
jgi:hypothetical protein